MFYVSDHVQVRGTYSKEVHEGEGYTDMEQDTGLTNVTCWICGKEFWTNRSYQKFCSPKCRYVAQNVKARAKNAEDYFIYCTDEQFESYFGRKRQKGHRTEAPKKLLATDLGAGMTISDIVREAEARGMSYGEYMRYIYAEAQKDQ